MNHDFIFDLSGHARQEIYDRTMRWIANNLRAPKAVIQSEDPETGSIIANGVTTMTAEGDSVPAGLAFHLSVDVREGRNVSGFSTSRLPAGRMKAGTGSPLKARGTGERRRGFSCSRGI